MSGMRYGRMPTNHFIRFSDLSTEEKLITAYLRSNPHANASGCYRLPLAYVSEDLRMPIATVSEGFRNICETGFIVHDSSLSWVLVTDHLDVCPVDNPNQGKLIAKLWAEIPTNSSVYAPFVDILRSHPANLPDGFLNSLERVSQPLPTPQPYPQPQSSTPPTARATASVNLTPEPAHDYFEGRELQVANSLFLEFKIPANQTLTRLAGQSLVFECERLGSAELAIASMRAAMGKAKARGDTINRFWFEDQRYDETQEKAREANGANHGKSRRNFGNRAQERTDGNYDAGRRYKETLVSSDFCGVGGSQANSPQ